MNTGDILNKIAELRQLACKLHVELIDLEKSCKGKAQDDVESAKLHTDGCISRLWDATRSAEAQLKLKKED